MLNRLEKSRNSTRKEELHESNRVFTHSRSVCSCVYSWRI